MSGRGKGGKGLGRSAASAILHLPVEIKQSVFVELPDRCLFIGPAGLLKFQPTTDAESQMPNFSIMVKDKVIAGSFRWSQAPDSELVKRVKMKPSGMEPSWVVVPGGLFFKRDKPGIRILNMVFRHDKERRGVFLYSECHGERIVDHFISLAFWEDDIIDDFVERANAIADEDPEDRFGLINVCSSDKEGSGS